MLPRQHRLPAPHIRSVLHKGRRIIVGPLQIVFIPTSATTPQFAFVVATAVDKRATARNRMKRLLRESVRALLPTMRRGADVVLVAKKGLPDTQKHIDGLITELLSKAGLL